MNHPTVRFDHRAHIASSRRLRILSYNIQVGIASGGGYRHYLTHSWKHLLPYPGRQTNLDAIARFIADFDLVGLQEVDAGSLRSEFVNQGKYLAQKAQFPYWYSQTNRNLGRFAKHGLALLGHYRPHKVIEHRLPGAIPGRGALEAHYGSPAEPLIVILLHLSLGNVARMRQFHYLVKALESYEHVIVMGDLNCSPDSDELRALIDNTRLCEPTAGLMTYPSWRPTRHVDHIFVTPELDVQRTRVHRLKYSDHLPVSMEIILPCGIRLDASPSQGKAEEKILVGES